MFIKQCHNKYILGILCVWLVTMIVVYTTSSNFTRVFPKGFKVASPALFDSEPLKYTDGKESADATPKQACVHPIMKANDPFMMKFVKMSKPTVCPVEKDWIFVENGTLHFSPVAIKSHKGIVCDYLAIQRDGDLKIKYTAAKPNISNPFKITEDAFKVRCKGGDGLIYDNIHQGVAFNQEYVDRKEDPMKDGFEGLSVVILGFDSMSRMSWLRRLPITRKYFVEKLGGIELEQHNIVGDGTTAVMFPMLTGKFEWELPECRVGFKDAKPMDNFPWIWHDFKKAGYLTSWSNGNPKDAPFNWRMVGFSSPPTDFYPRPFYLAAVPKYKKYCLGSQSRPDIWLKWCRDIFHMYKHRRKFLINFLTDFSHQDNNPLTEMDRRIQQLIQHLHEDDYLNNTLLILMGDHGARYWASRYTIPGKLEERLPYFSFLFPPWFLKKYPEAIKNLKTNTKRLTTPFDIYATLRNFFHYTGTGVGNTKDRGISLFKEVPLNRTCKDAGIASHWCACLDWKPISMNNPNSVKALRTAVDTMNGFTENYRSFCAHLSVKNVTSISMQQMNTDFLRFKKTDPYGGIYKIDFSNRNTNERVLYQITFETSPGGGRFEVTVHHDVNMNRFSLSEKEISRINMYGDAPHCILDKNRQLRQYCYCKDLIKSGS